MDSLVHGWSLGEVTLPWRAVAPLCLAALRTAPDAPAPPPLAATSCRHLEVKVADLTDNYSLLLSELAHACLDFLGFHLTAGISRSAMDTSHARAPKCRASRRRRA